ncbi:MAG: diguanylate cyclase [Rhodocyclaceae bacterium]|nr:diguanylate cyclase [Rhodocyclaceae bacterium]MCP5297835.1 diguanylate cyclase [Zoogloeaceae bacterium]MCW5596392.1 diguanylate cyclase [Rhodocyclaceae bacterium]
MNPMDMSQFEKLKALGNLPSPKGVALAIMRLTQKEDASMAELARIIKPDPAFVGRLIKAANSVNANPGRPVVSVQEALVVLGMPAVRNLSLGFSLLSQHKEGACRGFDYPRFWASSLACGIALQALTLRTRAAQAEEAFSVGLLARVGELALATLYAGEYADVLRSASKSRQTGLVELERERFAIDHRYLTAAMLIDWGLPRIYCDSVRGHELCDEAIFPEDSREYLLQQSLGLARLIADICTTAEAERAAHLPRLHALGERVLVANDELTQLCDSVVREWREWAAILGVAAPDGPNFEALAQSAVAQVAATTDLEPESAQQLRVLVVDDDRSIRLALRALLEADGYAVSEAADGREGLRIALDWQPHMLVTDRVMPHLDGMEMTRTLRGTRLGRDLYILMLTALDEEDRLLEGYQAGVDDYLAKPLNPRMILARLRAGQRIVRLLEEREHDREELRRFAAELSISNRRLEEMALTDVLTGLPNRRHAMARIEQEWAASMRSRRPLSCMVIDLDQFKQVNDIYGHDVGDAYLTQVASAIRGAVRTHDVVARTGGDEFQVICPDTDLQAALACAERIRCAVEQSPIVAGARRLKACMSAGVAERELSMPNADALIKRADEGVYLAKQQGRNRVASPQNRATR